MKMHEVLKMAREIANSGGVLQIQEDSQMPTLQNMAKNLIQDGVKWVSAGMQMAKSEVAEQRLSICKTCEFFAGSRCSKCGCQMRVKTTLATSSCPIGKWGPVTAATEIPASNQKQTNPPAS